ncbi:MAG: MerR family transcriptional regulator, partial [Pseudonocardiaceae bacterium]
MSPPRGIRHKLDDQDFPAYTMGLAAELLGVQPAFLRSLDAAGLLSPGRSAGGQRRYSRADLTLALEVRELLDQNMPLAAAIRIVSLERQLAAADQRIAHLEHTTHPPSITQHTATDHPRDQGPSWGPGPGG